MLRIPQRRPHQLRIDRLAEYMREFADLLGTDNSPMFAGIKDASTGLRAAVPAKRRSHAWKRIHTARYDASSRPAKVLRRIESLLGEDHLASAELLDDKQNVLYLFHAHEQSNVNHVTIKQHGEVDGMVTGLVGADDTMHLHLRDCLSRDLKLVIRQEELARNLLKHFREGLVRLRVHGIWARTDDGWVPEANRCVVDGYEPLDETPAAEVFAQIASIPSNGWTELTDPAAAWRDIRGAH